MIKGTYLNHTEDLTEILEIRRRVFNTEADSDAIDPLAVHVLLRDEGDKPVAAGRIHYDGDIYKVGKIAVLEEERRKGYGEFVVRMLLDKAFQSGAEEVFIDARVSAVDFYKKLGFIEKSQVFELNNAPCQVMSITKSEVCRKCQNHT